MNADAAKRYAWLAPVLLAGTLAAAPFDPLFRVMNPSGQCEVIRPGSASAEPAARNHAYPYGTTVYTGPRSSAIIMLSRSDAVQMGPETIVTMASDPDNPQRKILRLKRGRIVGSLDAGNEPDALTIETPVARAQALQGRSSFQLRDTGDAFTLDARSETGSMTMSGPQFRLPEIKNGFSVRITTTRDNSMTRILNTLGAYVVLIENGTPDPLIIDSNTRAAIRIWREHAPVGGRLIVSVLATGADGKGQECFAFAVGQPDVASGMLLQDESDTNGMDRALSAPAQEDQNEASAEFPSDFFDAEALFP